MLPRKHHFFPSHLYCILMAVGTDAVFENEPSEKVKKKTKEFAEMLSYIMPDKQATTYAGCDAVVDPQRIFF